jgi:hypothetical protein
MKLMKHLMKHLDRLDTIKFPNKTCNREAHFRVPSTPHLPQVREDIRHLALRQLVDAPRRANLLSIGLQGAAVEIGLARMHGDCFHLGKEKDEISSVNALLGSHIMAAHRPPECRARIE